MPSIFKHSFFHFDETDTVVIPDAPELPEELLVDDEFGLVVEGDMGEEDVPLPEDAESIVALYKKRLALTKEEFFAAVLPELEAELNHHANETIQEAYSQELTKQHVRLLQVLDNLDNSRLTIEKDFESFIREYTSELKYMAIEIAERILLKEITTEPRVIEEMVIQLVSEVKNASWINIEVSDKAKGLADYLKSNLEKLEQGKELAVVAKDAPIDTCRLETEAGVIDATVSTQLDQIKKAFMQEEEGA